MVSKKSVTFALSNKTIKIIMYVIKCNKGKNKGCYLSIDYNSGGYPYWSSLLNDCKTFDTFENAKEYTYDFHRYSYLYDDVDEISIVQMSENISLTIKL